jgi:hypothetical protein
VTVYVDDAVHPWRGQRWAHLMADTLAELHAMAAQLGIPRGPSRTRPAAPTTMSLPSCARRRSRSVRGRFPGTPTASWSKR